MDDVNVVVLGGGQGRRLYPLTEYRSKPAVPIAGKYRLIDIPVSNSLNSGLRRIFVLTQFNSASLNRHVNRTYRFDPFSDSFVEILAAEQTEQSVDWYQGTADAVRKHIHRFKVNANHILVLSGDQLYRMDYRKLISYHHEKKASVTVSVVPVTREQASGFGVLRIDENGKIVEFYEKPKDPQTLDRMECPPETLKRLGFTDPNRTYLASMGIYLFNTKVLDQALKEPENVDFGHDIIPRYIYKTDVYAYIFDDYWEDIGTIRAFFEAMINLGKENPNFHFYSQEAPIYTRGRFLPGSKLYDCRVHNSVITEGCLVRDSVIEDSILGIRTRINRGSTVRRCVIMGADYYELHDDDDRARSQGRTALGIGENVHIENCIVDKNARIGDNVVIKNAAGHQNRDGDCYVIRDGIVIIPKNGVVPAGKVI